MPWACQWSREGNSAASAIVTLPSGLGAAGAVGGALVGVAAAGGVVGAGAAAPGAVGIGAVTATVVGVGGGVDVGVGAAWQAARIRPKATSVTANTNNLLIRLVLSLLESRSFYARHSCRTNYTEAIGVSSSPPVNA